MLLIPALVLGYFAQFHLRDGMALDRAVPVPVFMIAHVNMPKAAYEDAAAALAEADGRDGEAAITLSEARMRAGETGTSIVPVLSEGLARSPASARGWTLMAEATLSSDRKTSARALGQALLLAPRDYWLVEARVRDAALLWSDLDAEAQTRALDQTRMLWQEPLLHDQLFQVLHSADGIALTARAFAHRDDEIRAMNRWLSHEQRRLSQ